MISATMRGRRAAYDALGKAAKKIQRDGARKAAQAASKIVLKSMKQAVPVASGLLRKSLGRKVKSYRGAGISVGIIGPRTNQFKVAVGVRKAGKHKGQTYFANPTRYAHLVDKGTRRSKAYHFRAAVSASTAGTVREAMADAIRAVVVAAGGNPS